MNEAILLVELTSFLTYRMPGFHLDHVRMWRFHIVPKRNEAILLVANDVSKKLANRIPALHFGIIHIRDVWMHSIVSISPGIYLLYWKLKIFHTQAEKRRVSHNGFLSSIRLVWWRKRKVWWSNKDQKWNSISYFCSGARCTNTITNESNYRKRPSKAFSQISQIYSVEIRNSS